MLEVFARTDRSITAVEKIGHNLFLSSAAYRYRIQSKAEGIFRITMTGQKDFSKEEKPGVIETGDGPDFSVEESKEDIVVSLPQLVITIHRRTGAFTYSDTAGRVLLRERREESKCLEEFVSYRLANPGNVEKKTVKTADGEKQLLGMAERIEDERLYHTWLHFEPEEKERFYGLGQQEEGLLNLRGKTVYLHQANRKIAIPLLVSSGNYGILMDTYSPMVWNDNCYGTYLYTEADREMDFYFIAAKSMEEVIKGYRFLTGKASMLPKWAYGYLQSQERYETREEICSVAEEYRKRGLGLDGIVLDWCSWKDGFWGQKEFDETRFPNPAEMVEKLHEQQVHFMISIWPNMSENCPDYQQFSDAGLLLAAGNVYNAFSEEGRKLYWEQVEQAFYQKGVDAFWCDSSEPYTPEWNHLRRQEPFAMFTEYQKEVADHMPAWLTNAFALFHAKGIYEGQRGTASPSENNKRVFNLTRSAYTGQQRYGTVMWSGDTDASWKTFRRQIRNGLSFSASGMPYWTADIGAFFVKKGEPWYWNGDYPDTLSDKGYQELFVRWFQWGCFLPLFRGHGTDCRRELWQFETSDFPVYEALERMNHLRYEFMPYIYSLAGSVYLENRSFLYPLSFVYPGDENACEMEEEYLFGENLLVCPVTEPMYYDVSSMPMEGTKKNKRVYLPKGNGWYDFWTNTYYGGGTWVEAEAPLEKLPLFVKEGSILPMTEFRGSALQQGEIYLKIYTGTDAEFLLYEDAGDGYGYETGEYVTRHIRWDEAKKECRITEKHGDTKETYCNKIEKIITIDKEDYA